MNYFFTQSDSRLWYWLDNYLKCKVDANANVNWFKLFDILKGSQNPQEGVEVYTGNCVIEIDTPIKNEWVLAFPDKIEIHYSECGFDSFNFWNIRFILTNCKIITQVISTPVSRECNRLVQYTTTVEADLEIQIKGQEAQ